MILSVIISAVVILIVMYSMSKKGQTPLNLILRSSEKKKVEEEPEKKVEEKESNTLVKQISNAGEESTDNESGQSSEDENSDNNQDSCLLKKCTKEDDKQTIQTGKHKVLIETIKAELNNINNKYKPNIKNFDSLKTNYDEYVTSQEEVSEEEINSDDLCNQLTTILIPILEALKKLAETKKNSDDELNQYKHILFGDDDGGEDTLCSFVAAIISCNDPEVTQESKKGAPCNDAQQRFFINKLFETIDGLDNKEPVPAVKPIEAPKKKDESKQALPIQKPNPLLYNPTSGGQQRNKKPNPLEKNNSLDQSGGENEFVKVNTEEFFEQSEEITTNFINIEVNSQTFTYSVNELIKFAQEMFLSIQKDKEFIELKTGEKFKELFFSRYFSQYLGLITSQNNFKENKGAKQYYFTAKNLIKFKKENEEKEYDFVNYFTRLLDEYIKKNPDQFKKENEDQSEEVQRLQSELDAANAKVGKLKAQIEENEQEIAKLEELKQELTSYNEQIKGAFLGSEGDKEKLKLETDAKVAELEEQLQAQATVIEEQQKEQAKEIAKKTQEIKQLGESSDTNNEENKTKISKLEAELEQLKEKETKLKEALTSNQALQQQISALQLKDKSLKTLQDNLNTENTKLKEELETSQTNVKEKEEAIAQAQESTKTCKETLAKVRKDKDKVIEQAQIQAKSARQCNLEKDALNAKIKEQDKTIDEINSKINELQKKQFDEFTCMFDRALHIDEELKKLTDGDGEKKTKLQSELTEIIENIGKAYNDKFGSEFRESEDTPKPNIFTDLIEQIKPYMSLEDSSTSEPPTMIEECFSCLTRRIDDEANRLGYERILKRLSKIGEEKNVLVEQNNSLQKTIAEFDEVEKKRMADLQALSTNSTINEEVKGNISKKLSEFGNGNDGGQPQPQYDAFTILLDLLNEVMEKASDASKLKGFLKEQAEKMVKKHEETQIIIDNGLVSGDKEGTCSNHDSTKIKQLEAEITRLKTELDKCNTEKARVEAEKQAEARAAEEAKAEAEAKAAEAEQEKAKAEEEAKAKAEEEAKARATEEAKAKAEEEGRNIIEVLNPIKRQIHTIVTEFMTKTNVNEDEIKGIKEKYDKYFAENEDSSITLYDNLEEINSILISQDHISKPILKLLLKVDSTLIKTEKCGLEIKIDDELEETLKNAILNDKFRKQVTILYGYLTNPFQIMIGVTDPSNTPNDPNNPKNTSGRPSSTDGKVEQLICQEPSQGGNTGSEGNPCIVKERTLSNNNYSFDHIYLPKQHQAQFIDDCPKTVCSSTEGTCDRDTSLHKIDEIDSLLTRFDTETGGKEGKNFMLMHYGYSGTGKTYVAEKIINDPRLEGKLVETRYTYGKIGNLNQQQFVTDGYTFSTFIENKNDPKITDKFTYSTVHKNHYTSLDTAGYKYLEGSMLKKESLNNPGSSRFHLCRVYKNEKNNYLYFFDLAGSEDSYAIIMNYVNETEYQNELRRRFEAKLDNELISFKNVIGHYKKKVNNPTEQEARYKAGNEMKLDIAQKKLEEQIQKNQKILDEYKAPKINKDTIFTEIKSNSDSKFNLFSLYTYVSNKQDSNVKPNIKDDVKNTIWYHYLKKDYEENDKISMKNKIDLLFESYYINHSLDKLKASLNKYKSNKDEGILIPEIGLGGSKEKEKEHEQQLTKKTNKKTNKPQINNQETQSVVIDKPRTIISTNPDTFAVIDKPIIFDKILMYGFVRNDMGYNKNNDKTFLNGTIKTFDFLQELLPGGASSGGTLIKIPQQSEKTENLLTKIFMKKAGALAESGYKSAFVDPFQSQSGGGGTVNDHLIDFYKGENGGGSGGTCQDGGGILDKSVVDTDRALLIAVTFVISLVTMHVKKMLYNKEFVHDRRHMLYVMLGIFFVMMMLFKVIVRMETIDTMYMLLYVLMFSIVNVAVNMFQMDVKTTQSLNQAVNQIEDELNVNMISPMEHVDEDIQRENKYDSNMLLSWAITSVAVIFV